MAKPDQIEKCIGMRVTSEEIKLIEQLKTVLKRSSVSDLIRFLILQEAEKILK